MQVSIINGIFTDESPSIRTSYPLNLLPIVEQSGVNNSYLKPADGIVAEGTGPGINRGGILWNDVLYRVMGSSLVLISSTGSTTTLGDVGDDGKRVSMAYSFDRLAVVSAGNLFYWDGTTLTQVTDPDVGSPVDIIWVDSYFLYCDTGDNLVVTELADPTSIDPLKYGSSEIDPDPVVAVKKVRNEPYAVNRYTIEAFRNTGSTGFPFQRITGAQIQKGAVGKDAVTIFMEQLAFVGSGRHQQPSVFIAANGQDRRIATREIDKILSNYSESELSEIVVEYRHDRSSELLYVHLPDQTLVYNGTASEALEQPVWAILSSEYQGTSKFLARDMVWAYQKWCVGHPETNQIGYLTEDLGEHWGNIVRWEFGTPIIYNESNSAIFNDLELVALTGRVAVGAEPKIRTSYSLDGQEWSQDQIITAGGSGDRLKRLVWFRQGLVRNMRMQRFQGTSDAHIAFLRLNVTVEPLSV